MPLTRLHVTFPFKFTSFAHKNAAILMSLSGVLSRGHELD